MIQKMLSKAKKVQCILCNGVFSCAQGDTTRFHDHLSTDHEVRSELGQSWVMAVSLLDLGRREKILATIMDNINTETEDEINPGEESDAKKTASNDKTKVILNIDISDDEADGDWDKNFETVLSPEKSFVELDESFGPEIDPTKYKAVELEENTKEVEKSTKEVKENLEDVTDFFECRFCDFKSKTIKQFKKHLSTEHSLSKHIIEDEAEKANGSKEESNSNKRFIAEQDTTKKVLEIEKNKKYVGSNILETIDKFSQFISEKKKENSSIFSEGEKRKVSLEDESKPAPAAKRKRKSQKTDNSSVITFDEEEKEKDAARNKSKVMENEEEKLSRRALKNKLRIQLKPIEKLIDYDSSTASSTQEVNINLLKEDLLKEGPAVDLSGSSYFQFHKSMIKNINVKDLKYENVSRVREMPGNWFLYVSFFNDGKRKVTEYITPDRKLVRGKAAAIEFMKASNEYTEEEIKGFANHLGVKLNEN